jgi:starch synthase (maltosyl-transferring)
MCFSKSRVLPDGQRDTVIVVANLDPHATRESVVHLTMPELGLSWTETFRVHDHVTDQTWVWGENNYLRLGPDSEPVHILTVVPW